MLATGLHAANFKGLPNVNCRFTGSTLQGFFGVVFGFFGVVFWFGFFWGGGGKSGNAIWINLCWILSDTDCNFTCQVMLQALLILVLSSEMWFCPVRK